MLNLNLQDSKVKIEDVVLPDGSVKALYGIFNYATYVAINKYSDSIISKFEITKNSESMVAPLNIKNDQEQDKLVRAFLDTESYNVYYSLDKNLKKILADVIEDVMNAEHTKFKERLSANVDRGNSNKNDERDEDEVFTSAE